MKSSLLVVGCFVIGVFVGVLRFLPITLLENDVSLYILYVLMFFVGLSIGIDRRAFSALRSFNMRILLVPVATIGGTFLGVTIVWFVLPSFSLSDLWAVGAGYGYYSLSSVFITELRGEDLGVVALLANISREIITLLAAPVMAKWFGRLAPIASGGATSMDTTLPIIAKSVGVDYAIVSVFHGTVLTVSVPVLVPFFLSFGG